MIRRIRSLCTNILARIVPAIGARGNEVDAQGVVRRRVEVTVEREFVSIRMPAQSGKHAKNMARGRIGPAPPCPELPAARRTVSPAAEPTASSAQREDIRGDKRPGRTLEEEVDKS